MEDSITSTITIDLFCGPSHESWSPKSSGTGIGGSEEMCIGLMRELAKLGNKVRVWSRCSTDEGIYDGVEYINYDDFSPDGLSTDVLIVWRNPELLFQFGLDKLKCKKYLWLHDTIGQLDLLPFLYLFDRIMVLSKWHRGWYEPFMKEELHNRFWVTRNAIDYADFKGEVERDPYTIVYGSLYNRGLVELLTIWPKIKLTVPEAKLRVFYGWETLEKIMPLEEFTRFKEQVEGLLDQEGIEHLGRISHEQVAKEMLGAGIWAYPCTYNEVSCITAVKAQVGGAVPVVIPKAALHETVQYGIKVTHGNTLPELLDNFAESVILALTDLKGQEAMRRAMKHYPDWSYTTLADEWMKEFV